MGNLEAMNQAAEAVANRDDAPFPKINDTPVFIPDNPNRNGSHGHYEDQRTGRDGVALTVDEFWAAFMDEPGTLPSLQDYEPGRPVTGFAGAERRLIAGSIGGLPFFTIMRTPNRYLPVQTTGLAGEPRQFNQRVEVFNTYVGNLWVPIDYPAGEAERRVHASLFGIVRDAHRREAQLRLVSVPLAVGAEAVAEALQDRRSF